MIYLSVVKLIFEGTFFDSNCWIIESEGESVIDQLNPFLTTIYECCLSL